MVFSIQTQLTIEKFHQTELISFLKQYTAPQLEELYFEVTHNKKTYPNIYEALNTLLDKTNSEDIDMVERK